MWALKDLNLQSPQMRCVSHYTERPCLPAPSLQKEQTG